MARAETGKLTLLSSNSQMVAARIAARADAERIAQSAAAELMAENRRLRMELAIARGGVGAGGAGTAGDGAGAGAAGVDASSPLNQATRGGGRGGVETRSIPRVSDQVALFRRLEELAIASTSPLPDRTRAGSASSTASAPSPAPALMVDVAAALSRGRAATTTPTGNTTIAEGVVEEVTEADGHGGNVSGGREPRDPTEGS